MEIEKLNELYEQAVKHTRTKWSLYVGYDSEKEEGHEDICWIPEILTECDSDGDVPGQSAVEWIVAIHNAWPELVTELKALQEWRELLARIKGEASK
jgi:hypothetical protein